MLGFIGDRNTDYFSYLFGDILSISIQDIYWIFVVMAVVILLLVLNWKKLLLLTLNEELAKAEGINKLAYELLFMFLIALAVSVSVQIVGVFIDYIVAYNSTSYSKSLFELSNYYDIQLNRRFNCLCYAWVILLNGLGCSYRSCNSNYFRFFLLYCATNTESKLIKECH